MSYSGNSRNCSLFIKNIAYKTEPEMIRRSFNKFGDIADVHLPVDYSSKERRGFGYVQFVNLEDAEDALDHMDGVEIDGKVLRVEFAQGDRKSPGEMRGTGGRGGGGGRSFYGGRSRTPPRYQRRNTGYGRRSRSPGFDRGGGYARDRGGDGRYNRRRENDRNNNFRRRSSSRSPSYHRRASLNRSRSPSYRRPNRRSRSPSYHRDRGSRRRDSRSPLPKGNVSPPDGGEHQKSIGSNPDERSRSHSRTISPNPSTERNQSRSRSS